MKNKQTAVEWLQGQYYESEGKLTRKDFEQAKEMEKEQIIDAVLDGCSNWGTNSSAEQYYNETYGLVCNCEAHTFYEWEKMENKCCQCKRPIYEQN